MSRQFVYEHYKKFFNLSSNQIDEDDEHEIDWGQALIEEYKTQNNRSINREVENQDLRVFVKEFLLRMNAMHETEEYSWSFHSAFVEHDKLYQGSRAVSVFAFEEKKERNEQRKVCFRKVSITEIVEIYNRFQDEENQIDEARTRLFQKNIPFYHTDEKDVEYVMIPNFCDYPYWSNVNAFFMANRVIVDYHEAEKQCMQVTQDHKGE